VLLAGLLYSGVANPIRGTVSTQQVVAQQVKLPPGESVAVTHIGCPSNDGGFSITGTFQSDRGFEGWGIESSNFSVWLYANGYFAVNHGDRIEFIHLRPETNTLSLTFEAANRVRVWLNAEVAWSGTIEHCTGFTLLAKGGLQQTTLYFDRAVFYNAN
jgi:hypothetical protein